ncbi:MAG: hypothetical protein M1830_009859, partial [Pleopsidium flavum]
LYFGVTLNKAEDIPNVLPAHDEFVKSACAPVEERGVLHRYIMVTYSSYDQPVIESYGPENVARLKAVQNAYDPGLVSQRLVDGGQKTPFLNVPLSA